MPADRQSRLRVRALRGGTIGEITTFLADFEGAYIALYRLDTLRRPWAASPREWLMLSHLIQTGVAPPWWPEYELTPEAVLPQHRLLLDRVHIASPGFWEFVASANPLQQLREYLNDRHKRRQDHNYREQAERERLNLENELLRNQILRSRVELLRDVGVSDEELQQSLWSAVGVPLARLGTHQDSGLIEGAEEPSEDDA